MFNQYFGYYLLKKGLLTPEQLTDVFFMERSVRPRLGVLAIDAGMMNAKQVEEIQQLQHRKDRRFGELALEEGYLTAAQLEELLDSQKASRQSLSQVIIDREYLSLSELATALEEYKAESQLTPTQLTALQNADYDIAAHAFTDFSPAGEDAELLYSYVSLILRNILRFVGEEPVIDPGAAPTVGWRMSQRMSGRAEIGTSLVMNEKVLVLLAKRYSGEPLTEADELAKDAVAEFLNENNGVFTVNMSDRGEELELYPPEIEPVNCQLANHFRIPLRFTFGQTDLYLSLKKA